MWSILAIRHGQKLMCGEIVRRTTASVKDYFRAVYALYRDVIRGVRHLASPHLRMTMELCGSRNVPANRR